MCTVEKARISAALRCLHQGWTCAAEYSRVPAIDEQPIAEILGDMPVNAGDHLTPQPLAFDTAAASSGLATGPMLTEKIG